MQNGRKTQFLHVYHIIYVPGKGKDNHVGLHPPTVLIRFSDAALRLSVQIALSVKHTGICTIAQTMALTVP
jgi:hypothetical protein